MTLPELLSYASLVVGGLLAGAGGLHGAAVVRRRNGKPTPDEPDGQTKERLGALWRAYRGQEKRFDEHGKTLAAMAGDVKLCVSEVQGMRADVGGLREWRAGMTVRVERAEEDIDSLRRGARP